MKQGAPLAKPGESRPAAIAGRRRTPAAARAELDLPRPRQAAADADRRADPDPRPGRAVRRTSPPVAANVPRSEPKALPASGWHAAGETASVYARTPSTQAAHPQPMEQPRETVLR